MNRREYIAFYDDGHDFGGFLFYSEHRAGSEANKEDARAAAIKMYGHNRAQRIKILRTELNKWGVIL